MKAKITLIAILLFGLLTVHVAHAQEINCSVRINSSQISGTDRSVFESLRSALYEFINNTKWTNINFKNNEKIECSMVINLRERVDNDAFSGSIDLVVQRPAYKASYTTPIFNYIDSRFMFNYMDGQTLDFNPNTFTSSLTSTIAFYVYMFLGYEFDTFSLNGGETFFKIAENIVNAAQSSNEVGWMSSTRNNRYWLCENMNNARYQPLHIFLYEYHRLGLDVMAEKPDEGRAAITKALNYLQEMHAKDPTCYFLQVLLDTKRDEIINIYSQATQQEKTKVVGIMKAIDPSQATAYDAILQNPGN